MPCLRRPWLVSPFVFVAAGGGCGSAGHAARANGSEGNPAVADAGGGEGDAGSGRLPDGAGGVPADAAATGDENAPAGLDSGDITDIVACFGPPTGTVIPECGASCGNGVIDTCAQCGPQPGAGGGSGGGTTTCNGVDPYRVHEQCDGTNLGGATCASLGFTGGTLTCAGSCDFDTSACVSCASGPSVGACSTRVLADLGAAAAGPWSLAVAATDDEVLLAWTEAKPTNSGGAGADGDGVHLARFRASDLSVLGASNCLFPGASEVTLARSATGYVLAYMTKLATATTSQTKVDVQALDPSGVPIGTPLTSILGAEEALLVPRQGPPSAASEGFRSGAVTGGPLLLFWGPLPGDADGLSASLLGNDGSEDTAPVVIPQAYLADNGVFTGNGFLVGTETELAGGGGEYSAYVASIGLDGHVAGTTTPAGPGPTASNQAWVAWSGSQARAVYAVPTPTATDGRAASANWIALDAAGAAIASSVQLPAMSRGATTISAMAAGIGDDTAIVLLGEKSDIGRGTQLDVIRVSGTGATVTAPFNVVADAEGISAVALATSGTDVVVAWIGGYTGTSPRLGIARVTP